MRRKGAKTTNVLDANHLETGLGLRVHELRALDLDGSHGRNGRQKAAKRREEGKLRRKYISLRLYRVFIKRPPFITYLLHIYLPRSTRVQRNVRTDKAQGHFKGVKIERATSECL